MPIRVSLTLGDDTGRGAALLRPAQVRREVLDPMAVGRDDLPMPNGLTRPA